MLGHTVTDSCDGTPSLVALTQLSGVIVFQHLEQGCRPQPRLKQGVHFFDRSSETVRDRGVRCIARRRYHSQEDKWSGCFSESISARLHARR
jgi:hypothetical protein